MNFKTLTITSLAGALVVTGFADQLMAGVAMPVDHLPPAVQHVPAADSAAGFPFAAGDGDYFLYQVDKKKWKGEGGEGGEGAVLIYPAPAPAPAIITIPTGCASHKPAGMIIGGVAGAMIGHQFGKGDGKVAATALGALLGVFVGHSIGAHLDAGDAACAEMAAGRALEAPVGTRINWNNPDSGAAGSVKTTRDGTDNRTGQYCREYQQTIQIGGQSQNSYGVACQQPDGNWQIQG